MIPGQLCTSSAVSFFLASVIQNKHVHFYHTARNQKTWCSSRLVRLDTPWPCGRLPLPRLHGELPPPPHTHRPWEWRHRLSGSLVPSVSCCSPSSSNTRRSIRTTASWRLPIWWMHGWTPTAFSCPGSKTGYKTVQDAPLGGNPGACRQTVEGRGQQRQC